MFTCRRASLIEQGLLRKQDKGAFGMSSVCYKAFGLGDLFGRAPNMHGCSLQALAGLPGDRGIQSPIHFAHSRSVSEFLEFPSVARRQYIERQVENLPWCE